MLVGLVVLMAPIVVLVVAGVIAGARQPRPPWIPAVALLAVSTAVWLVQVGLYQHETPCDGGTTGCPTLYGYDAPLPDEHVAGFLLLLVGFAVPAAWVGWRRLAPPLTTGAALALGPTVLAWWTSPRGDNDGLWALVFWTLPVLGGLAAIVAAVAGCVSSARGRRDAEAGELTSARSSDRLAALAIDIAIAGTVLVVPLTMMSNKNHEIAAAVLGVASATAYLAVPLAWKGRTVGQSLVGLFVLDSTTKRPIPFVRAFVRSLIVVLEVVAIPTIVLALPAAAELISLAGSGRTLTDRLLGTAVLSEQRVFERPLASAPNEHA